MNNFNETGFTFENYEDDYLIDALDNGAVDDYATQKSIQEALEERGIEY